MTTLTTTADRLLQDLDDAAHELRDLETVNLAAADEVLGYIKPPIRTGRLASTVRAAADAVGFTITAGGPEAPYGPIVHARVPFLDLAAEQRESAVVDVYTDHVQQLLDDIQGA